MVEPDLCYTLLNAVSPDAAPSVDITVEEASARAAAFLNARFICCRAGSEPAMLQWLPQPPPPLVRSLVTKGTTAA